MIVDLLDLYKIVNSKGSIHTKSLDLELSSPKPILAFEYSATLFQKNLSYLSYLSFP